MKQVKRIEGTINRFLDFTKPRDLVFLEIDITDLIEDVLFMVKPLFNRQECVLNIRMDDNLPKIIGDRKSLAEAMINLLVNALEAISDHGTVSILSCLDHFSLNGVMIPSVRIDISDTGQGIAPGDLDNIFDPFYTTAPAGQGSGLGLSICYSIIKQHFGTIVADSEEGKGSTFSVRLPLL